VTRLSPEVRALVAFAGSAWRERAYFKWARRREIRMEAEAEGKKHEALLLAEMETQVHAYDLAVARAIKAALDAGSTKVALMEVTSKNPGEIGKHLAFLEASGDGATAVAA
jgi:hypothetical protein